MKTIHQIKDEVVQNYGWESWEEIYDADGVTNHIIEVIAERTAREALKNAADNATLLIERFDKGKVFPKGCLGYIADEGDHFEVDKESILSDKNIPRL